MYDMLGLPDYLTLANGLDPVLFQKSAAVEVARPTEESDTDFRRCVEACRVCAVTNVELCAG